MLSLPGIDCQDKLTPSIPNREAKAGPCMLPSPARGGGLGWGLTELASKAGLSQFCGMRGGPKIIGRARLLRRNTTRAERLLWGGLRNDQLGWRFRRQHPIPPYIVDFACVEARLVVEADGGQHSEQGDEARDQTLRPEGWRILGFWNNDILENCAGVLQVIAAELGPRLAARPHPNPPPLAGEGTEGHGGAS